MNEDNNANIRLFLSQICLRNASQNETPFHFAPYKFAIYNSWSYKQPKYVALTKQIQLANKEKHKNIDIYKNKKHRRNKKIKTPKKKLKIYFSKL